MSHRTPNARLVKYLRTYTVEEIARLFTIHRNTVRNWLKNGLASIDQTRPILVHGQELIRYLDDRRKRAKRRCEAGQLYCFRCRVPQRPALNIADLVPVSESVGNLKGICPVCETIMNRRVSMAHLDVVSGDLVITTPQAQTRIG
mgnify:CR=1 FL=1